MKFIHILLGTVLLAGYISYPFINNAYRPEWTILANTYLLPFLLVTLTGATANILLGCYLTIKQGVKRGFQSVASLLILAGGFISLLSLLKVPFPFQESLATIIFLTSGLILHFVLNLHSFNPSFRVINDASERETGTVKWFNNSKGFGFITRDKGADIFVHYRAIRGEGHRTLVEGQRVEFIIARKDKGLQAEDVIAASGNH